MVCTWERKTQHFPFVINETSCGPVTAAVNAAGDFPRRLLWWRRFSPPQHLGCCNRCKAATANHVFQRSTQTATKLQTNMLITWESPFENQTQFNASMSKNMFTIWALYEAERLLQEACGHFWRECKVTTYVVPQPQRVKGRKANIRHFVEKRCMWTAVYTPQVLISRGCVHTEKVTGNSTFAQILWEGTAWRVGLKASSADITKWHGVSATVTSALKPPAITQYVAAKW